MLNPVLHTQRLTLRLVEPTDQRKIFEGLSHPQVIPYYGVSYERYEDTAKQMGFYAGHHQNGTGYLFKLLLDEVFIGVAGVYYINHQHHNAETGYWLFPEYWGRGLAAEALEAVLLFAFNELKLHRIKADIETENQASRKLVQKLGFTCEGIMRDCEFKNGAYINMETWSLLSTDKRLF